MSRRSRAAVGRSTAGDRWGLLVVGLLALVGGLVALATGFGLLGEFRAGQPVLDPATVDLFGEHPNFARVVTTAFGLLVLVLGLAWAVRSLRPERRPRVVGGEDDPALDTTALDTALQTAEQTAEHTAQGTSAQGTTPHDAAAPVTADQPIAEPPGRSAMADVVTAAAATLPGVAKARARLVGSDTAPALRLTLWLAPDAEVRTVCDELEPAVLAPARAALVVPALPAAVRFRLA